MEPRAARLQLKGILAAASPINLLSPLGFQGQVGARRPDTQLPGAEGAFRPDSLSICGRGDPGGYTCLLPDATGTTAHSCHVPRAQVSVPVRQARPPTARHLKDLAIVFATQKCLELSSKELDPTQWCRFLKRGLSSQEKNNKTTKGFQGHYI